MESMVNKYDVFQAYFPFGSIMEREGEVAIAMLFNERTNEEAKFRAERTVKHSFG